jgi:hypothetical protein
MREILRTASYPMQRSEYNISDYRRFLKEHVNRQGFPPATSGIETAVISVNSPWSKNVLMPFAALGDDHKELTWWDAYNDVKHSDLEKVAQGNLTNCLNSCGALAILNSLAGFSHSMRRTFGMPVFADPVDEFSSRLF